MCRASPTTGGLVSCNSRVAVIDLAAQSITKYLGGFTQPKEIAIYGAVGALQVTIDIKPGSSVNPINLKSRGKVPVATLSDPAFDATTVDGRTVVFAGASPLATGGLPEDVTAMGCWIWCYTCLCQDAPCGSKGFFTNPQSAICLSFISLCLSCQSISISPQSTIRNPPFIYLPGTYSTTIDLTISPAFVIPLISV
jgi:hypothetical protein